jgi:hypothetical protein
LRDPLKKSDYCQIKDTPELPELEALYTLSKSSPPRCVSPEVESTSNTPSPTSNTDDNKIHYTSVMMMQADLQPSDPSLTQQELYPAG